MPQSRHRTSLSSRLVALPVAVLAAAAALATGAAMAAAGFQTGSYKGTTSQGQPVSMSLPAAHRVARFQLQYVSKCDSGKSFSDNPTVHHAFFTGTRFSGTASYQNTNNPSVVVRVDMAVSGRPAGTGRAKGTFSAVAKVFDSASTQQIDTCRTGPVTWTAARHR